MLAIDPVLGNYNKCLSGGPLHSKSTFCWIHNKPGTVGSTQVVERVICMCVIVFTNNGASCLYGDEIGNLLK